MDSKTKQAKDLFDKDDLKGCLKIMKTFKLGLTKDEKAILTRTYEMLSGKEQFYSTLGFTLKTELDKTDTILKKFFKKSVDESVLKTFKEFINEDINFHQLMSTNKPFIKKEKFKDFDDDETDSTVRLVNKGDYFLLTGLETSKENQGKGGAKRVMQQAIDYATDMDMNIELAVLPDEDTDKERLIGFYKSFGFRETGQPHNHMRLTI